MAIDTIKATAILDGAVDTADLADGAVTAAKITDGNITTAKIADGEITDAKIASGITSSKLTGALPAIDGSSLTGVDPADGSITTAKLDSTLDLSGKTVTYGLATGDLPAGSIVKVDYIQGRAPNTTTSNNTTTYATDFTVTYDIHSGGNKLVILCSYQHFGDVDNDTHTSTSAQFKMQISHDGGTTYTDVFESGSSLLDRGGQTRFRTSDFAYEYNIPSAPTNDQIKVRLQGRRVGGTRSYNMGGQTGSHLTFIEVAV